MVAGEIAVRPPGAAVVQVENVQADLPQVDGQVEVLLVTREAVQEQNGGARVVAGGAIQTAEEATSLGRDESGREPGAGQLLSFTGR
jgi:hypothetical protein